MGLNLTAGQLQRFLALPPEEQARRLAAMSYFDALAFDAEFEVWAHKGQVPPGGEGWRVWLMMAGRGFGKTRAGAEWVHRLASIGGRRIALVAASIDEARKIMVEGVSGLLAIARNHRVKLKWEPSLNQLSWPKGSVATLYSGDSPDGLRGPEHHIAWCDELAKWRRAEESWNNLQMGLRLGPRARALVTTTPRPMPLLEKIRGQQWTVETHGRTEDNVCLPQRIDMLLCPVVEGPAAGAPPASPPIGACYLVDEPASGAWSGQGGALACFTEAGWRFVAPREGMTVLDRASGLTIIRRGGVWESGIARLAEVRVNGDAVLKQRQAAVPNPSGGSTIDAECRVAVIGILDRLRAHGLIA